MKDSGIEWIGEIPEDWKTCKIKNHFSIVSGATPKSEITEFWDGDIPWITPADYKTHDKFVSEGRRFLTQAGYDSCGTTLVPAGSIIFSKRAPVGTVAISKNSLCTNQGCLSCVPKADTEIYYYFYVMSIYTEQFELFSTGTTFKEIGADDFANFILPSPDYEKQKQISDFLDAQCGKIDGVIEKTRETIGEYKKLKQSVITQAVTKGIRPNRPLKPSGIDWIGDIPENWKIVQLKRLASIQTGNTPPKTEDNLYFSQEEGIPWIKAENLGTNYSIEETTEYLTVEGAKLGRIFPPNTVYVCCIASVGKVGFSTVEASCNQQINGLIFKNIYWKYGFYLSLAQEQEYITNASGNVMKIINSERQSKLICPLPLSFEQQEIADYLDEKTAEIDALIARKEQFISEMESYKKSLIYEYVTGKKEILSNY